MKKIGLFVVAVFASVLPLAAQATPPAPTPGSDVASTWPGVHYQVAQIYRLPNDRLLIAFRVYATAKTAPGGVLIGIQPVVPTGLPVDAAGGEKYLPTPFSFATAVLTDEQTHAEFKTVEPSPTAQTYLPEMMVGLLRPNEERMLTIQFPIPPPPALGSETTAKQTLSLLLPKAEKPITGLLVPPVGSPLPQ